MLRGRQPGPAVAVAGIVSVTAALLLTVGDSPPMSVPDAISGPYARLLGDSTDLGPARSGAVQVTAALHRRSEPVHLMRWAGAHGLSVRWRDGNGWAVIEGRPAAVAEAFRVAVRDYRIREGSDTGRVFAASPQQPGVPDPVRSEVSGLGRILGYTPTRGAMPLLPPVPRDVPDGGLLPSQLLNAYNATPLVKEGHTGKGQTVAVFAFDGFQQRDMDTFADMFGLPRFTPEVMGGMPERRTGEANMDLQVIHAIAPDAKLVLVNARETISSGAFEKLAALMNSVDSRYPGAIWSFSIGWGCDRLFTEADFTPVREALAAAIANGTTAFNATGDLAGMECKRGESWSAPPNPDDVGVDAVASLPEMTATGGTKLSTDADGQWLSEQSWYNTPLIIGTAGGASTLFARPDWQTVGIGTELPDRRLVPDVSAVSDPFTGVRIVFNQEVKVGGGTSQAAPIWAGLTALMNDKLLADGAKPVGELNPVLYRLAKSDKLDSGLRDINLGGNAISISGTVGYDMVTGLGTPHVDNLVRSILLARAGA